MAQVLVWQRCSICRTHASFHWLSASIKAFRCHNCGRYQVTAEAEDRLLATDAKRREVLCLMAHSPPPGHVLLIQATGGAESRTIATYVPDPGRTVGLAR